MTRGFATSPSGRRRRIITLVFLVLLGGTAAIIRLRPADTAGRVAAQGDSVLIRFREVLVRVHADGRVERLGYDFPQLGESRLHFGTTSPVVSPDQQSVAFVRDRELWILDVARDTAAQRTRVGAAATNEYAAVYPLVTGWSADSRLLLYHLTHGQQEDPEGGPTLETRPVDYGYYILDLASGARSRVELPGWLEAWLPSGDFLLTSTEAAPRDRRLLVYDPTTGAVRTLNPTRAWYGSPSVEPSGATVLLSAATRTEAGLMSRIVRVSLTDGTMDAVTPPAPFATYHQPRFSPTGTRILYLVQERVDRRRSVYHLHVDDRDIHQCAVEGGRCRAWWIDDATVAVLKLQSRHDANAGGIVRSDSLMVVDAATGAVTAAHGVATR